jgi:DNA polymerase-3 subunit gamma/tau
VAEQPAYVAIARKWRPLTLEEMVGQTHVTRTLKNALASGRIHHAFLFTGARGVGKTTAARALARALQCLEGPTVTPCGVCGPCRDILAGTSPDVVEIDGASNNSVEDVRDLRDGVRYLPATTRFRIYIIDEVHMLSKGAFNALLKTLEEPPPHVKFIFATTEVNKIPETILSRVQRFDFKRIPASVVVSRLKMICEAEGIALSEVALRMVARAGEGSMRDAQSLLDQVISFGGARPDDTQVADILGLVDRGVLYEMLTGLMRAEPDRCLDAIAAVHDSGYEIAQFTGELLELVRNAALVGLSPGARKHLDVPEEEKDRLLALVDGMPAEQLSRVFQVLLEVHDQVARASRPRMVLEMAVARLVSVRPAQPIAPLVERLVDLERRLRAGGAVAGPPQRGARGREPGDDPEGER